MSKPSFLSSTLSLAFIVCVASIIVMMFMGHEPSDKLLTIVASVISAYLSSRNPSMRKQEHAVEEVKEPIPVLDDPVDRS